MKLLIVGGTGVLSSAVVNEAIKQGINITLINRGNNLDLIPKDVEILKSDIHNYDNIKLLLKGKKFDAIIDFICFTKEDIDYSYTLFKDFINQFIFISSCAVYNSRICSNCEEDSPKGLSIWNYSKEKLICENYLNKIAQDNNIPYTIVRPGVTYGNTRIPYGIMPDYGYHGTIIERIKHGKPIITWDGGSAYCNITRVEDFAIGVVGLIGNKKAYNEAYNICGDETPTWLDVLNSLSKAIGCEIKTFNISSKDYGYEIPNRMGEIIEGRAISVVYNNKKIKAITPSFKQNIFLDEGIKKTVSYYLSNNYLKGIDYAFDADTDRIIAKYAKRKNVSIKEMNIRYIDYLGDPSIINKIDYYLHFYKNIFFIKLIYKFYSIAKRVLKKIKKSIQK